MVGGLIVFSERWHGRFTGDYDLDKPQASHKISTPRVGGLAVFAGTLAGLLVWGKPDNMTLHWLWPALFVASLPVFGAGILEDVTKDVGAGKRLLAAFISAAIAWWFFGGVSRVGVEVFDYLFSFWFVSLLFTVVAVGGCTHALNLVDGMNGLASMVSVLMSVSIALVAYQVGDMAVFTIALSMSSAIAGFFVWNFPFGRVFLGDGGAYFIGFVLAELAVLLVMRNPSVSAFYALAVLFYPVFETLFSIWRRKFKRGVPVDQPDALHLHQLIFRRLVQKTFNREGKEIPLYLCNALTSPYLWILALVNLVPATLFWDNTLLLCGGMLLFSVLYVWLYSRLVKWRSPKWLLLSSGLDKR
ncbi:glycosyl transferase [Pelistega sp. NLN82]|uniref:Glycosyl transferase n=1 Tax=Pelistega ratti TaxID=2652177 RepID=A0A6L9Y941_9BURK|nr:glycosyltransferase [Pelistega ratti]NEN76397.1 glycosyl transferase [Pelistega ratti]